MNVADKLVEILESNQITHIFGIPGDQILPMYEALSKSDIKHILTKHEQAAAHAADAFTRTSSSIGVCMATAGPGALNMIMATGAAYKDSIPILILTGDNDVSERNINIFQGFPIQDIFSNIVQQSYAPLNGSEAVFALKAALYELKNNPKGPIHINLSRDVLLSEDFAEYDLCYLPEKDMSNIDEAQKLISNSKKPLFVLGAGAISEREKIQSIAEKYKIPITTTYNGRGIISEDNPINLGLLGVRSTPRSNKAFENTDCIIALGTIASRRTFPTLNEDIFIHVNNNADVLRGKYCLHCTVDDFLSEIEFKEVKWINNLLTINNEKIVEGINDDLKPQSAIKRILDCFSDDIIVADAGSHTTFATLLYKAKYPNHFLFPAATAPMGYGLPAAVGAAVSTNERIIVINGDGDFQMNIQELATLKENNLNVIVFILNNDEYGIIRQWQEDMYDMGAYQVKLNNPNFVKLASAYGIDAVSVSNLSDLEYLLENELKGPLIVEIKVDKENIPLPGN